MRWSKAYLFQREGYQIQQAQYLPLGINPLDKENVVFIWTLVIHSVTCKAGEKWIWNIIEGWITGSIGDIMGC